MTDDEVIHGAAEGSGEPMAIHGEGEGIITREADTRLVEGPVAAEISVPVPAIVGSEPPPTPGLMPAASRNLLAKHK